MAIAPLNEFKSITFNVTTSPEKVYDAPISASSIILIAQVANTSLSTRAFSAYVRTGGQNFDVCPSFEIPAKDTLVFIEGKFVLGEGDELYVFCDANSALQLTMSVLETSA